MTPTETIRVALAAATPGPWNHDRNPGDWPDISNESVYIVTGVNQDEDARLIASAPTWLSESCDERDRHEAELIAMRRVVGYLRTAKECEDAGDYVLGAIELAEELRL